MIQWFFWKWIINNQGRRSNQCHRVMAGVDILPWSLQILKKSLIFLIVDQKASKTQKWHWHWLSLPPIGALVNNLINLHKWDRFFVQILLFIQFWPGYWTPQHQYLIFYDGCDTSVEHFKSAGMAPKSVRFDRIRDLDL